MANSALTHSTPGAIVASVLGPGPIPNGNNEITITKNNNGFSHCPVDRMASFKSRRKNRVARRLADTLPLDTEPGAACSEAMKLSVGWVAFTDWSLDQR